jgi:hypothetical protein
VLILTTLGFRHHIERLNWTPALLFLPSASCRIGSDLRIPRAFSSCSEMKIVHW